jgi:hypothetical protein
MSEKNNQELQMISRRTEGESRYLLNYDGNGVNSRGKVANDHLKTNIACNYIF